MSSASASSSEQPTAFTTPIDDAELVARLRANRPGALESLYERHATSLLRLAARLCGSADDAEDVVQDVFVGLTLAIRHYQEQGTFASWLRTVTARTALMHRRRVDRAERMENAHDASAHAAQRAESVLERIALESAIKNLPQPLRDVFVLYHIERFTHAEIADLLDIKRGTAEVRLFRAVRRLRALLEGDR